MTPSFAARIQDPAVYPLSRLLAAKGNLRLAADEDPPAARFYRERLALVLAEITRRQAGGAWIETMTAEHRVSEDTAARYRLVADLLGTDGAQALGELAESLFRDGYGEGRGM